MVITLTSIPPRFAGLGEVLHSLLRQGAANVVLCLPRQYSRYPGSVLPPELPEGVSLLWSDIDHGPATKLLPALDAYPEATLAYCDDDCFYAPGWLDALCAEARPGEAVAASGWSVSRLRRLGDSPPRTDIAQGYSGVLLRREMLDARGFEIPAPARPVDDIWLSGLRAATGTPLRLAPEARARVTPLHRPDALQDSGTRAAANAAAAQIVWETFGVWPPRQGAGTGP